MIDRSGGAIDAMENPTPLGVPGRGCRSWRARTPCAWPCGGCGCSSGGMARRSLLPRPSPVTNSSSGRRLWMWPTGVGLQRRGRVGLSGRRRRRRRRVTEGGEQVRRRRRRRVVIAAVGYSGVGSCLHMGWLLGFLFRLLGYWASQMLGQSVLFGS